MKIQHTVITESQQFAVLSFLTTRGSGIRCSSLRTLKRCRRYCCMGVGRDSCEEAIGNTKIPSSRVFRLIGDPTKITGSAPLLENLIPSFSKLQHVVAIDSF